MQSEFYKQYMKSDAWAEKRRQRLEIAGHKCEMCGRLEENSKGLQVHHITYADLGNEDVGNQLIALCGRCHVLLGKYHHRKRA